jgi:hypothetical protein
MLGGIQSGLWSTGVAELEFVMNFYYIAKPTDLSVLFNQHLGKK